MTYIPTTVIAHIVGLAKKAQEAVEACNRIEENLKLARKCRIAREAAYADAMAEYLLHDSITKHDIVMAFTALTDMLNDVDNTLVRSNNA